MAVIGRHASLTQEPEAGAQRDWCGHSAGAAGIWGQVRGDAHD